MLHHKESPEKPCYNMATTHFQTPPLPPPLILLYPPLFSSNKIQSPQPPPWVQNIGREKLEKFEYLKNELSWRASFGEKNEN